MEDDDLTKHLVAFLGCIGLLFFIAIIIGAVWIFFAVVFKGDVSYDSGLVSLIIVFGGWYLFVLLKSVFKSAINFYVQYYKDQINEDD